MLRYFMPLMHKLKVGRSAVWARLPGVADTVRTSLVYAALTALFAVLSASFLLYQSWRQYGSFRGSDARTSVVREKTSLDAGADKPIQVAPGQGEHMEQSRPASAETEAAVINNLWAEARSEKMRRPLPGKVVSCYGWQEDRIYQDWRYNPGVNVETQKGSEVRAVKSGKVKEVSRGSRGTVLKIEHGEGVVTIYGNLAECRVQPGQILKQGTIVGSLGTENKVLHFEVWQDSRSLDPSGLWDGE